MNECLTIPQHKVYIGYWMSDLRETTNTSESAEMINR